MTREEDMKTLVSVCGLLTEDGIREVVKFAAEAKRKEESPYWMEKRIAGARETVEMLHDTVVVLQCLAQKGNRKAATAVTAYLQDEKEAAEKLKRLEADYRRRFKANAGV